MIITNGDIPITRPEVEWIDTNLAIMELNMKARYTLRCTLSRNKYNEICRLKTKKKIFGTL